MVKSEKIWMNGELVDWDNANVHVLSHTLHYGLGLFEGIRCYDTASGPAVFRLDEHIQRLFKSAHIFMLDIPYSENDITLAVKETIKANNLKECYIRPLVYIGNGGMGLYVEDNSINLAIAVWPWGSYLGEDGIRNGIRVKTSSFVRSSVNSNMARAKVSGYYVTSQLAKREAILCGFDEALLLDPEGYVSEGSGENVFIVRHGRLKTTPLTSILEGITRESVIEIAGNEGIELTESRFTRDEAYISDEAFFSGTAAEITPIIELDKRSIGNGAPGEITKKIQHIFFDAVKGKNKKYSHWLTYI
ncbi:branched-chain-amino-acid aminotransferase [bacterium BMS3Abin07]|nr:branched-chain-amino-acid aminotransferase [bacterium BMS3Abin07]GBE31537.1 branched-chain-amino-acid aminotransferase [bacterium BMS3Bbin05]HDL20245.1 branched-chain amino acid transaminase [Nitrospirota bacterium]HDO22023.1 branched-chain amino acid transaminase [Nitrospirota bacterium]